MGAVNGKRLGKARNVLLSARTTTHIYSVGDDLAKVDDLNMRVGGLLRLPLEL